MLFGKGKLLAKIESLEYELAIFHDVQSDLQAEMAYFSLDTHGKIIEANALFLQSCEYSENEMVGHNIKNFIPKSFLEKDLCKIMLSAVSTGEHWHGAIQLHTKTGKDVWYRSIIQPKNKTNSLALAVYSAELTKTISNSREQKDMLAALTRSSAVIEFSLDGIILNANENFLKGMSYSLNQIVGKHHRIFCTNEEAESHEYHNFWKRLRAGEFVSARFKRIDSYGNVVWLEASYNPIHDDNGELYKVVKFATVITEQMNREFAMSETSEIAYDISKKTDADTLNAIHVIESTIETMGHLSNQLISA